MKQQLENQIVPDTKVQNGSNDEFLEAKQPQATSNAETARMIKRFLANGDLNALNALRTKAGSPSSLAGSIEMFSSMQVPTKQIIEQNSVIRNLASFQEVTVGDSFDVILDSNLSQASWGTNPTGVTSVKNKIILNELIAQPKMTVKMVSDLAGTLDSYIAQKIGESFALAEDFGFIKGSETGEPQGLLSQNGLQRIASSGITFASITALQSSLSGAYYSNASFLMHPSTEHLLKTVQDSQGRYIWTPAQNKDDKNRIFGVPIYTSGFLPTADQGNEAIIFGDFKKGYLIAENPEIQLLRDPYTEKPLVKYYSLKRIGGGVIDSNALKVLSVN